MSRSHSFGAVLLFAAATLTRVLAADAPLSPHPSQEYRSEWRDTFASRLAVLALMQTLHADILASNSATRSLEQWCRSHAMAADPSIVARRIHGQDKPPSVELLQTLRVATAAEVKYRRVELQCGAHVLSEADNWYVPARLTPEMNRLLDETETPFGRAIQALRPYRRTHAATILWWPLPLGWERRHERDERDEGAAQLEIPKNLFEHRAVLYNMDHEPFSVVTETYQGEILHFD
jgi:chorismate-pyruvate lyase